MYDSYILYQQCPYSVMNIYYVIIFLSSVSMVTVSQTTRRIPSTSPIISVQVRLPQSL